MTTLPSRPLRSTRATRTRRQGFTLIEMMVAMTIGAMVIASVYTIGSSAARHFQEQQRVSQLQLSVRLALDRLRRDAARAGFLATANSGTDTLCGPAPAPAIRAITIADRSAVSTAALSTMSGWTASTSHGDRLDIAGDFRTNDSYAVRMWQSNQLHLETEGLSFRRSFSADPTASLVDPAAVSAIFVPGTPLMVRLGANARAWATVTGAVADGIGSRAILSTVPGVPSCDAVPGSIEGWAQGGVTVAPVTLVRYEIQPAPPQLAPRVAAATGTNTVLMRTEINPLTGAIIDGPTPILEYAVHFDVDLFRDTAAATAPSRIELVDDVLAAATTVGQPATARGLRISIAARTPESDPQLSQGVVPLGDGTPRVFQVFAGRRGGARVRSAYTEIFLPNVPFI